MAKAIEELRTATVGGTEISYRATDGVVVDGGFCPECGATFFQAEQGCSACGFPATERGIEDRQRDDDLTVADLARAMICTECGREHGEHYRSCSRYSNED
jgi:predicted amidophosphoribosyltransferase